MISYCGADREAAENVCAWLESGDHACWIAPRDIRPGVAWMTAIVAAISQVEVVVVIVSPNTFQSKHVAREVERADSHAKTIVPFFIREAEPSGPLEYYLGSIQHIQAFPGPIEQHMESLRVAIDRTAAVVRPLTPAGSPATTLSDDDLVALGRAICWDVREELEHEVDSEAGQTISEPRHGQQVKLIDLACNRRARRTIAQWTVRLGHDALLTGEDLDPVDVSASRPRVVCVLDSLDGTQHWLRGRNLYCTALSIFARGEDETEPYRLRVSMVQTADSTVFLAREDVQAAFIDGHDAPLTVANSSTEDIAGAQVCTVCRRPEHWSVLAPYVSRGVPFAALYTFGGNPILAELARGHYDVVFQPDASSIDDNQELWDWLPGGHIAYRAGCSFLDMNGQLFDIPAAAERCLSGGSREFPFVAAGNATLAERIVQWLADGSL